MTVSDLFLWMEVADILPYGAESFTYAFLQVIPK